MSHHKLLATSLVLLVFLVSPATQAQTTESTAELKRRVSELMEQSKYTEALPLLEKIATLEPNDGATQFYLGFALVAQATNTKDDAARKALRVRARNAFVKAKSLQFDEPRLEALIQSLPEDGSDSAAFSPSSKADTLIREAKHF